MLHVRKAAESDHTIVMSIYRIFAYTAMLTTGGCKGGILC